MRRFLLFILFIATAFIASTETAEAQRCGYYGYNNYSYGGYRAYYRPVRRYRYVRRSYRRPVRQYRSDSSRPSLAGLNDRIRKTDQSVRPTHLDRVTGLNVHVHDDASSYQRTQPFVSEAEMRGDFPVHRTGKYRYGVYWDVYRNELREGRFEQVLTVPQNK